MTSECKSDPGEPALRQAPWICSSVPVEVQFTPTDQGFESRTECSCFDCLYNLTVFILEISKPYDPWKLLLLQF